MSPGNKMDLPHPVTELKDADALSLLLLHNLDDLKGMTKLLPLLAYPLFLKDQDYTLRNLFWEDSVNGQPLLIAELDLKYPRAILRSRKALPN